MADPRLNSIHLTDARRMEYRQAREVLLQARGYNTLCAVDQLPRDLQSQTIIESPDGQPVAATYWLVDRHRTYPLKVGVNTVGRSSDNDVVVPDGCVSRRHCAILVHVSTGCEIHDTASKNGTYLNGVRLTAPEHLRPGDEIRMCDQQYVFQARPDAPHMPPGDDLTFAH
jgi:pSer/pThr/pTyr-binding forkhead associated (FHA) protein